MVKRFSELVKGELTEKEALHVAIDISEYLAKMIQEQVLPEMTSEREKDWVSHFSHCLEPSISHKEVERFGGLC